MAEMISKWNVVDKLTALENEFQQYKPFEGFEHAMYRKLCELEIAIGKTPGVEVVRCEDCSHFIPDEISCPGCGTCYFAEMTREFDDFCSRGERKTNDC